MSGRTAAVVYLLHFDRPYKHAGLLAVVIDAGIGSILARTWPGSRTRERQINKQRGASRCCPVYSVRPRDRGTRTRVPRPRQGIRVGQEAAERSTDQAATRTGRAAAVRTGVLVALIDVTRREGSEA